MYVIGAGFPRTGTLSTKAALEQLGVGPCYHFLTQFERPHDAEVWYTATRGESVDWQALLADFRSTIDWPGAMFYTQLMEEFPDAKVLLNLRDPEKWYESISTTVYVVSRAGLNAPAESGAPAAAAQAINLGGWQGIFNGRFEDKEYALEVFNRWNQSVIDTVPAERLLAWQVTDGWEPLCRFLDRPVPSTPFPHLNEREAFLAMTRSRAGAPTGAV